MLIGHIVLPAFMTILYHTAQGVHTAEANTRARDALEKAVRKIGLLP